MPLPFDNMQASLALTQFLPLSGIFPANNSDPTADPLGVPLGSIRTFAGNFALGGSAPCTAAMGRPISRFPIWTGRP